jgi:hypothetical protein
LDNSVKTPDV